MGCTCLALYQVQKTPDAIDTIFRVSTIHAQIHTLMMVRYHNLATAALEQSDGSEAIGAPVPSDHHQQARQMNCVTQGHDD